MVMQRLFSFRYLAVLGMAAAFVVGCEKKQEPKQTDPATSAAVVAILAKADAVDGKTDKVISKCAACALGMDGSAEHALTMHEYKMHFCSAGCKTKYEKEGDKAIMSMKMP